MAKPFLWVFCVNFYVCTFPCIDWVLYQFLTVTGSREKKLRGVRIRNLEFAYARSEYVCRKSKEGEPEPKPLASDAQCIPGMDVTIVSNNLIHDIACLEYSGWALYTDEGTNYVTFENNICYNTTDNVFHQYYGAMNVVRNNIFAFSGHALLRVSLYEKHLSPIYERNLPLSGGELYIIY